jgi:CheY-like chemotaxis protein
MQAAGAPSAAVHPGGHRPLVLVVEDNPHHCEIYGRMLCYNGYDVVHAADGEEAVAVARRQLPDLVLLDLMIPGIDGLEVCRLLKEEPQTTGIPVVVLSSRDRKEWEPKSLDAGAVAFLEKPLSAVDVLHTVESCIGRAPLPGTGRPPLFSSPGDLC